MLQWWRRLWVSKTLLMHWDFRYKRGSQKWLQNIFERHLIWCSTNHSISPYFSKIDKSLYQNFSLVVLVPAKCGNSIPTYQNRFTCFLEMQQWGFYCARAPCQRRSVTCHVSPNAGRSGRLKGREVSFKRWNTSQNMLGFTGITWEVFFWVCWWWKNSLQFVLEFELSYLFRW